jgi:low affinity Fe/Cu permease
MAHLKEAFRRFAHATSDLAGSVVAFLAALTIVAVWLSTGPIFGFSDTWQLVINTGTTIITFLMVFLIQNTQNRDSQALHAKLDELILATQGARNRLADAEDLSDEELARLIKEYARIARSQPSRPTTRNGNSPRVRRRT